MAIALSMSADPTAGPGAPGSSSAARPAATVVAPRIPGVTGTLVAPPVHSGPALAPAAAVVAAVDSPPTSRPAGTGTGTAGPPSADGGPSLDTCIASLLAAVPVEPVEAAGERDAGVTQVQVRVTPRAASAAAPGATVRHTRRFRVSDPASAVVYWATACALAALPTAVRSAPLRVASSDVAALATVALSSHSVVLFYGLPRRELHVADVAGLSIEDAELGQQAIFADIPSVVRAV